MEAMMKRHDYRVRPVPNGEWSVWKEGETSARGSYATHEEAMRVAARLADEDERSGADENGDA
jgi:hypothetical protein